MGSQEADGDSGIFITTTEASEILSNQLLSLSLQERNATEEEIHGVSSMAPEETPELVERSLAKMMHQLNCVIPPSRKKAYLHALQYYPRSYIHQPFFRLRFLRSCLFDAQRAALRMNKFLNFLQLHFGEQTLQRPVELDDFSKAEQRLIKKGVMQLMPYRDRSGRKIMVVMPGDFPGITQNYRVKVCLYTAWICGSNGVEEDLEAQRKGAIMIVWLDPSTTGLLARHMFATCQLKDSSPTRVIALHVCTPNSPKFQLGRFMFDKTPIRSRIRIHTGSPIELFYRLSSFGIPAQNLPITNGGHIKTNHVIQWFKTRKIIEEDKNASNRKTIVECPGSQDIVFKRGGNAFAFHNPGNSKFRNTIQLKYEQGSFTMMTQSALMGELREVLRSEPFRIVVWNEKLSLFLVAHDEKTINARIEYMIRAFRENDSQRVNRRTADTMKRLNSSTSAFRSLDNGSNRQTGMDCCTVPVPLPSHRKRAKTTDSRVDMASTDSHLYPAPLSRRPIRTSIASTGERLKARSSY